MKAIRQFSLSLVLLALGATNTFAAGTLATGEVLPLLQQNDALYKSMTDAFDFHPSAIAQRVGNVGEEHLGGARIAPYEFLAKPKGSKGPWMFRVIVDAETKFFRKTGEEVTLYEGEIIKEKLTGVRILPLESKEK